MPPLQKGEARLDVLPTSLLGVDIFVATATSGFTLIRRGLITRKREVLY